MGSYRTVARSSKSETIVNKSRFIGECYPVASEADALKILESVRKQYWDARHHCYAFCIGQNRQITRSSDDGEPSGTGGLPILDSIIRNGLTNTLCVVTRYFGGILLGTGGLVRAYSGAASESIRNAGIVEMMEGALVGMDLSYPDWNRVLKLLEEGGFRIETTEYGETVHVVFRSMEEDVDGIVEKIRNRTDGRVTAMVSGKCMISREVL